MHGVMRRQAASGQRIYLLEEVSSKHDEHGTVEDQHETIKDASTLRSVLHGAATLESESRECLMKVRYPLRVRASSC